MGAAEQERYTASQVAAITGLSLPAVHKAIDKRVIRPRRARTGRSFQRLLTKPQMLYLRMEARGLNVLPLKQRRLVAEEIVRNPDVDALPLSNGSVVVFQCKSARREVESGLKRLARATRMVISDPEVLCGTPVFRGTRIPVHMVADMLADGASIEEIMAGYPGLTREKAELAPLYAKAFPRRGRPTKRPWAGRAPARITRHSLTA